jgi:hypothetical protein
MFQRLRRVFLGQSSSPLPHHLSLQELVSLQDSSQVHLTLLPQEQQKQMINYCAGRAMENATYGDALQLLKVAAAQGLTGGKIFVEPTSTQTVEPIEITSAAWFTTETVPGINTPINLNFLFPNNPIMYNVGLVMVIMGEGLTLAQALK